MEASSVHQLLTEEADHRQPQGQVRQGELVLQVSGDLLDRSIYRLRLSQALGNIINNTIHCTEAGGNVVIRVEVEEGEAMAMAVTDYGIGIDSADLPYIFDRFYRTDQSRSWGIGGTGWCLAITHAIVEACRAATAVDSEGPETSAAVTIRLPLER